MTKTLQDQNEPPSRSFIAKRLDRNRWWPVMTGAKDDEIDTLMRDAGFNFATRRLIASQDPLSIELKTPALWKSRWVRIMADVYADGVWNQDGEECLADDLPILLELRDRLLAWQAWYDNDYDEEVHPFDRVAFAAEGLAIARAVKAYLPEWTVIYFDESKSRWQQPRTTFEYAIPLLQPIRTPHDDP